MDARVGVGSYVVSSSKEREPVVRECCSST